MPLYQSSVLQKYLKQQDTASIDKAYKAYCKYFHNPKIQENIRQSKEEEYQGIFLTELFVKVLGYTMKPQAQYNLVAEYKNEKNSKKADGAILLNEQAIGVIELKGTNTKDLEKVRQQAFDYKANQTGCVYVITSNFEKLRFYINNAVDYEAFDLFNLSAERFALLWLCLAKENVLNHIPLKIKEASIQEEEAITKGFYKDYSLFKRELYRDLVKQNMKNEVFRAELNAADTDRATKNIKLSLFKKSQKLIDRFLFVFFAEDRGLLPPNSTRQILDKWKADIDFGDDRPLYDLFKQYFSFLDTGRKGTTSRAEIFAYNGGLFKPDTVLDSLQISSDLLFKHTDQLQAYDFESQVDVNILGHIFENSLNEIESVNAEIEGGAFDKQKSKRKKDGVFYTPKYITKYIVDNTVGKLCEEKKAVLGIVEEEYLKSRKGRRIDKLRDLQDRLDAYRTWLLQLTICDPACGSGAFLNQALDFLIKEHAAMDELKNALVGGGFLFPDIENTILENNIYGVDLNEESVEIAKLSLWLRTAQPRRKLNDLSSNIKCGNSLINSKTVAGDKAFKWEEAFPQVFAKGGFDVVLGNPPYVRLESIKNESEKLSKLGFETFDKRGDLYPLFVEKGMQLLQINGIISFIMPNKWLQAGYGKNLRGYFLKHELSRLIDFGDIQIFEGATTYPCIFMAKKSEPKQKMAVSVLKSTDSFDFETVVNKHEEGFEISDFSDDTWVISSKKEKELLKRISSKNVSLFKYINGEAKYGIKPGLTEAFILNNETYNELSGQHSKTSGLFHSFVLGRDLSAYSPPESKNYLLLFEKGHTKKVLGDCTEQEGWEWLEKEYPKIANWLRPFEEKAKKRTDKGDFWWELRACDYYDSFVEPKIMYQTFQVKPCFLYDDSGLFCNNSMWIIPTENKALVGLLNSKMGWWLITKYCTQIQNGCQLIWKYFGNVPVPQLDGASTLLALTEKMIALKKEESKINSSFLNYLKSQVQFEKPSKKLQNWPTLTFADFIKELNKAIKAADGEKLSKLDEMEWMEVFETKKAEADALQSQIDQTDREIDQMVYELYGLTEDEIAIVESSN